VLRGRGVKAGFTAGSPAPEGVRCDAPAPAAGRNGARARR
jgi:hypothetical protein